MLSAVQSFVAIAQQQAVPVVITPIVFTANVARSPGPGIPGVIANTIRVNAYSGTATIDWGDGTNTAVTTAGLYSKTYPNNSTLKTIAITSDTGIGFRIQEANRVIDVVQWGTTPITNAFTMLANSRGLTTLTATDTPTFSGNVDASYMFSGCSSFNTNISNWNMSPVSNTASMFRSASAFNNANNSGISNWNVTNVTDMTAMFYFAGQFNQPIGSWSPNNLITTSNMFYGAGTFNNGGSNSFAGWANAANLANTNNMFNFTQVFNQPLGEINMSNVTDASRMFSQASAFNNGGSNNINNWNVAKLSNAQAMFNSCYVFNQPVNNWNTANVINMSSMFNSSNVFNQDLGGWNVSNVTNFSGMFQYSPLFNNNGNTMSAWNTAKTTSTRFMFMGASAFNQPMNSWNLSNVGPQPGGELGTAADYMFMDAVTFNQDLSTWCVPQLLNGGVLNFDTNTPAWTLPKPVWGTCPP